MHFKKIHSFVCNHSHICGCIILNRFEENSIPCRNNLPMAKSSRNIWQVSGVIPRRCNSSPIRKLPNNRVKAVFDFSTQAVKLPKRNSRFLIKPKMKLVVPAF